MDELKKSLEAAKTKNERMEAKRAEDEGKRAESQRFWPSVRKQNRG